MTCILTIREAKPDDQQLVWDLIHESIAWLRDRGLDQWYNWQSWQGPNGKVMKAINEGSVWLAWADTGSAPVGTITVEPHGDLDFWTPDELLDSAYYVSKVAIARDHAGQELGNLLLNWARDLAFRNGIGVVRLDAWRSNTALHRYYQERGWRLVRDVYQPHRQSGVLFERGSAQLTPADAARIR